VWTVVRRQSQRAAKVLAQGAAQRLRSPAERAGRWSTAFLAPLVVTMAAAVLRPVAFLLAAVIVAPAALHAVAGDRRAGRRGGRRWLAPLDVLVRTRNALRLSVTRAWIGLLAGAVPAIAVITLAGTQSAAPAVRGGLAVAALAHVVVLGREPMFRSVVDRLPASAQALTRTRWASGLVWIAVVVAVAAVARLNPTWWPAPQRLLTIFRH
jgi:hypothetical protein